MKTIQIDDDMYDFLMLTSKELNTQDNRHTQSPIFRIYEEIKVEKRDGCGNYIKRLDYEGAEEHYCRYCQKIMGENDYEIDSLPEIGQDGCCCDVIEDAHWTFDIDLLPSESDYDGVAFLTEKAAKEYLDDNKYHFDKGAVYAESAFRNWEMNNIINFLKGLTDGK